MLAWRASLGTVGLRMFCRQVRYRTLSSRLIAAGEPWFLCAPGYAGAIVMGDRETYASKRAARVRAGVKVLDTPSDIRAVLRAVEST